MPLEQTDRMSLSPEELQWFRICGTCYSLYETGRPDGLNQQCRCSKASASPWPQFDFNERARLCTCCGLEALASGSRWSPYFCRECQLLAMGVSLWERRLVIPIGRHSMMHTWVPDTSSPSLAAHGGGVADPIRTVATAISEISTRSDRLSEWSAMIVSRHLRHLGLTGSTPLIDYLGAIAVKGTGATRWGLFAEFSEFLRASPDSADEPERA